MDNDTSEFFLRFHISKLHPIPSVRRNFFMVNQHYNRVDILNLLNSTQTLSIIEKYDRKFEAFCFVKKSL